MYAYLALITRPESRATRLAVLDGTESLFVVIGTLLSPIIKNQFGRYTSYGLKIVCSFLALLYTIFLVKEPPKSVDDKGKKQKTQKLTIITPLLSFVDLIKTVFKRFHDISYQIVDCIYFFISLIILSFSRLTSNSFSFWLKSAKIGTKLLFLALSKRS